MITNFRGDGRTLVGGYVRVSPAAKTRLAELGVSLRLGRDKPGYESFYLPDEFANEFVHIPGNPGTPGRFFLKGEKQ
ncbi:hypothetical protein [Methylocaldum szegediense]|uniref:hypothetical protein n=1 Tax=Methylocaldum szegediense TaxID=73780 RepID=UPI00041CF313|nr:hypothetical protein [Methylocaldum szegediense]